MAKLTKEQIEALALKLSHPWGRVGLLCDGRRIDLEVRHIKTLQYRVMTFIDGVFKGAWTLDQAVPEQKFLRKTTRHFYSPKRMVSLVKAFGKREAKKMNKTLTVYWPDWANGKAALNHLNKVCESVEIAPEREEA